MIACIDHFVLTVRSIDETCAFYERVLGMRRVDTPGRPTALAFGQQKINIHQAGHEFSPHASLAKPGTGDFCLISEWSMDDILAHLADCSVELELGPVPRNGARGPMTSVYLRDPDGNLVEVSVYGQP